MNYSGIVINKVTIYVTTRNKCVMEHINNSSKFKKNLRESNLDVLSGCLI